MTTLQDFLRVSTPIELKRAPSAPAGFVSGYASTFGGAPDSYGDVIAPGAFAKSIARHQAQGTAPLMLWSHDETRPIGRWDSYAEDVAGLMVAGQFNINTDAGRDAREHVLAGDLNGLSIGYRVMPGGAKAGPNGIRILTELDLLEVSIVAFPANQGARVTGAKSMYRSRAELEAQLRTILPGRAAKKLMSGGWPALSADEDEQPNPAINELLSAVKAARLDLTKDRK
ncbi:HK97 family phage prohead protease [Rhodopseudomonas palustris]|nr:HK97 family phage prohead protease [Rhodopseudomonas palustris]